MLKIAAALVVGFFVVLWSTGNDLNSFRAGLVHWADGNAEEMAGGGFADDWGD